MWTRLPGVWVKGPSRLAYLLGQTAVLAGAMTAALALTALIGPFSPRVGTLAYFAQEVLVVAVGVLSLTVYGLLVSLPLDLLPTPEGLWVDFGLRKKMYPWREVHQSGNLAILSSGRGILLQRVSLSPQQREVLEAYFRATRRA